MRKFLAASLVSVLLLAACGTDADDQADTPTPTATVDTTETPSEAESTDAGTETEDSDAVDLPDPRSLTGVSYVESLGDPEPIEGDFEPQLPVTVIDHEDNEVTVTDTSRILALDLTGTLSRTVIALGYGDSIVGRSISSTEAQLADVPVVTEQGHSLNAEAILNLRPTLILADRSVGPPEVINQLRASGVTVVLTDPDHSLENNSELLRTIAEILGVPEAGEELVERTEAEIDEAMEVIADWAPEDPLKVAFLYVRGTAGIFFILGSDSGTTSLIEGVGARDIATEHGIAATTPANPESLLLINPEVIFTMTNGLESTDGIDGLLARPGVSDTIAGTNSRVIAIPDGMSLSFGPQTGEMLIAIARALYGVDDQE